MLANGLRVLQSKLIGQAIAIPLLTVNTTSSSNANIIYEQQRTIVHRNLLKVDEDTYPDPWPYKEKGFTLLHAIYDRTLPRFHQNSKLIVVEGNVGSKKSETTKELADELGFYYMPEFKMDHILIDRYGNDLRNFYHLMPQRFRLPDMKLFCADPNSNLSAVMSDHIFQCRFEQYLNALAHILNTGQGVVLERSPYSDFVFVNAMRAKNYIGLEYFKYYYFMRKRAIPHLFFWPHLVIYIDTPVELCLENLRNEGNVDKIATMDEQYLRTIDESYKDVIRDYRPHSKILIYDWSTKGDTDKIIEDIENIDFDFYEWHSSDVFSEWFATIGEVAWGGWRNYVTTKDQPRLEAFFGLRTHEVNELTISPSDAGHFLNVIQAEVLKSPYTYGYNHRFGDSIWSALFAGREGYSLPEPWYEYFHKEAYIDFINTLERTADPYCRHYNPDYLKEHH